MDLEDGDLFYGGCSPDADEGEMMGDDLGERESEAILKLLDLAKFAILAMLVGIGALGIDSLM